MTIRLLFDDETEQYIHLMCTRKGISIEDYILGNLEWDDKPECIRENFGPAGVICGDCEWNEKCPDAVLP